MDNRDKIIRNIIRNFLIGKYYHVRDTDKYRILDKTLMIQNDWYGRESKSLGFRVNIENCPFASNIENQQQTIISNILYQNKNIDTDNIIVGTTFVLKQFSYRFRRLERILFPSYVLQNVIISGYEIEKYLKTKDQVIEYINNIFLKECIYER